MTNLQKEIAILHKEIAILHKEIADSFLDTVAPF